MKVSFYFIFILFLDPQKVHAGVEIRNDWLQSQTQLQMSVYTNTELTKSNQLQLLHNKESHLALLKLIQHTKALLFINVLSLVCDETTKPLFSAMSERVQAGAKVRILLNKGFSYLDRNCIKELKATGIEVTTSNTHSSYFVNDNDELIIGAQSLARMFFLSNGENGYDRDTMIYARGPVATDAIGDFLNNWISEKENFNKPYEVEINFIKSKKAEEIKLKNRDFLSSTYDLSTLKQGYCRFLSNNTERPQIERAWEFLIKHSQSSIFLSGVRIDSTSNLIPILKQKSQKMVEVNYMGNGFDGGNGELTMYLNELIEEFTSAGSHILVKILSFTKEWNMNQTWKEHQIEYNEIQKDSKIQIWTYKNFLHHKIWSSDDSLILISSANLDQDQLSKFTDAGIVCFDQKINDDWKTQLKLDIKNSFFYNPIVKTKN